MIRPFSRFPLTVQKWMGMSASQLESYLKSLETGQVESEGEFSIDVDKALEKLAAYQLPFKYAWVLKLVQAAVASGAAELDIKQTSSETYFRFPIPWSLDELEEAFHKPPGSDSALSHLMTGLWSASLNDGRPFLLRAAGSQALMWTGREMRRVPKENKALQGVEVSHRRLSQGKAFPILNWLQSADVNSSISRLLTQRACFSPIPIRVDRRQLEPHGYPTHQWENNHYLKFGWKAGDEYDLSLPIQTFVRKQGLAKALPQRVQSSYYLTAHLGTHKLDSATNNWVLRPKKQPSRIVWVVDGVVLRDDPISEEESWISVLIVASAEGLRTDLTGFDFQDDEELARRTEQACLGVSQTLNEPTEVTFDHIIGEVLPGSNIFGGVASYVGGSIGGAVLGMVISPPVAMLGVFAGGITGLGTFIAKNEEIQAYPVKVLAARKLNSFRTDWLNSYPPA